MNPKLKKKYNLTLLKPDVKFKKGDIIAFKIRNKEESNDYEEKWLSDIARTAFIVVDINSTGTGLLGITKMVTLDKQGGWNNENGIWECTISGDDFEVFDIHKLTRKPKKRIYSQSQRLEDLIL